MLNKEQIITSALRTIDLESRSVAALADTIDNNLVRACELILSIKGRVIITGMGKSGHIAKKIAATLASTGTPAFYVHPGEASHGDMGMITAQDIVLALSNSGTSPEILTLLPLLKRLNINLISMTGQQKSTLAKKSDIHLYAGVKTEACPLNLAPTSSTTAALVMGDVLAIALLECRGFTAEDFAFSHPSGALGRKLLVKVGDLMTTEDSVPMIAPSATLADALMEITAKGVGMTTIAKNGCLLGVFTDGDLRRALEERPDINKVRIDTLMSPGGKTIPEGHLAAEALRLMEHHRISSLVVTSKKKRILGIIHLLAILNAGIV